MGTMPNETELALEQSQQGVSYEVLLSIEGLKNEKEWYGYIKNHKKIIKNGQARARESEENKKNPKNQSRGQKVKDLSQIQSTMVNRNQPLQDKTSQ
ncbi:hypothetical protein Tco_1049623 [Tanacetum coccineum]